MRKRTIPSAAAPSPTVASPWLDLESIAEVELTSEDPAHPIEQALREGGAGWRAATPGEQIVRLIFAAPLRIGKVRLVFRELQQQRSQEFSLHWSADGGQSYREIVRQGYTFSPPGTTEQAEEYTVNLDAVRALELRIVPAIGGGDARASLERLAIAG